MLLKKNRKALLLFSVREARPRKRPTTQLCVRCSPRPGRNLGLGQEFGTRLDPVWAKNRPDSRSDAAGHWIESNGCLAFLPDQNSAISRFARFISSSPFLCLPLNGGALWLEQAAVPPLALSSAHVLTRARAWRRLAALQQRPDPTHAWREGALPSTRLGSIPRGGSITTILD